MSNNKLRSLLLGFMFLLPAISASAQATSATLEADALYAAEKWNEAAPAYEALTKTHSNDGRVWYRLGYSLHLMGKYEEAARAFQRSVEIGNNPLVMYNLACAYARLGEKDKAFEWLNKSLTLGFVAPQLSTDPDLAGLRSDARFKEVTTAAARLSQPCKFRAEHKQFDFWVGDWDVKTPQGQ
ncbi:MAG TPA: tetratricopeptide repeat protein, partial [Blastocatellia bacterium]|nr:tetratricopeptide repeat protein [Blastocatellia bacterium]